MTTPGAQGAFVFGDPNPNGRKALELGEFLDRLTNVRTAQDGYTACCPAHDDHNPSLSVRVGDKHPIVVKCHRGCTTRSIVEALGLRMRDLMGEVPKPGEVVDTYHYFRADGSYAYSIDRRFPKDFRIRPAGIKPADRVLFRLDAVAYAREHGLTVRVVEGEKDVLSLIEAGVPASTNPFGAGKWLDHYSD